MAELNWDDVLTQTGSAAKKKGLEAFSGQIVKLDDFKAEERGRKNKRFVLTAQASSNGTSQRVLVPERYADRIRELIDKRPDESVVINAKVETGPRGAMLKPVTVKEPSANPGRRGRPRKVETAA